jgi:ankyrin repeat protein
MLTSRASHQRQQLSQNEKSQLADLIFLLRDINAHIIDPSKTKKNITSLIEHFEKEERKKNKNFKMEDIVNSDLSFIAGELLGMSENLGNGNSITVFGSLMQFEKQNSELQQKKIIHTLEILISKGADVNIADSGRFPLFTASLNGNLGIVNFLLKQSGIEKSINRLSKDGVSSLFSASQRNHVGVVRALIDAGADVYLSTSDNIPLHTASENGHLEIVKQLISDRVLSDYKDFVYEGQVSLYLASQNGHVKVVEELLTIKGLDLDYIHKRNNASAIHVATQNGHSEIVELFLERGANVNLLSSFKSSLLHIASEHGHLEIVKTILKHDDVQINAENHSGGTALIFASQNGYAFIVEALIQDKRLNLDYSKAITSALKNNHFNVVEKLISDNSYEDLLASVQVESLKFNSFDSIMIYKSFKELFEILEDDKKEKFLTAKIDGKTILEHAIENKNYEVAKLIYNEEISLLGAHKTEEELENFNIKIVKKAFSNLINEVEFFEFIKLVIDDKDGEIFKLVKVEIPQVPQNMNRELTDIWKLYREKDFRNIKLSILQDPQVIVHPKYEESSVDHVKINPKTLLHRLAEDGSDECVDVLESVIKCLKLKKNPILEVLNSRADIEYVDRKTKYRGFVKGVTALYLAVNNQNLKAIEALIEYSNFDCPLIKVDNAKTKTNYSILELALERASLKSVDLLKSTAILKILTGSNKFEKKAKFPKSEAQKNKIAEKFYSYPEEIQKILLENYPEENIKERADKISAMSSVGVEFSHRQPPKNFDKADLYTLERGMTSLRIGSGNVSSRLVDEGREEDLAGAKVGIRRF